jgi:hypothetical protein
MVKAITAITMATTSKLTFALKLSAVATLGLLGCTHNNTDRKANPIVLILFMNWLLCDKAADWVTGKMLNLPATL